nr:MAG TPA: hypothetical protein [Microviridae sp.]
MVTCKAQTLYSIRAVLYRWRNFVFNSNGLFDIITYKELIRMLSATTKATEKTSNRNQ